MDKTTDRSAPGRATPAIQTLEKPVHYTTQAEPSSATVTVPLSQFTSTHALNKTHALDADGNLVTTANAFFYKGNVELITAVGLDGLVEKISTQTRHQAIGTGTAYQGEKKVRESPVVTDKNQEDNKNVSRTLRFFKYPGQVSAFIQFDLDGLKLETGKEAIAHVRALHPALKDVGLAAVPSTTSGLSHGGKPLGGTNWHVWGIVNDGSIIPVLGENLFKYGWLNGYGRIQISTASHLLIRGAFDKAVFSPERLVFCAQPVLCNGIVRDPPPIYIEHGKLIDESAITWSDEQESGYQRLVDEAKRKIRPQEEETRKQFVNKRGAEDAKKLNIPLEQAKAAVRRSVETQDLDPDFLLLLSDGPEITALELVRDWKKYDNALLRDPFERSYGNDSIAQFYSNQGHEPVVFSFAHGGVCYTLRTTLCAVIEAEIANLPDHDDGHAMAARIDASYLRPVQREGLRKELAKRLNVSKNVLPQPKQVDENDGLSAIIAGLKKTVKLIRDDSNEAYGEVRRDGFEEIMPIKSEAFGLFVQHFNYKLNKTALADVPLKAVINAFWAAALFDPGSEVHEVNLRTAAHGGDYYIDTGDAARQVIKVSAAGVEVQKKAPVLFIRTSGMRSLPDPNLSASRDDINLLWFYLNVCPEDRVALIVWILEALRADLPYLILVLRGETGTGKTTAAGYIRRLVDPHEMLVRAAPQKLQDLTSAIRGNALLAYNNLSSLPRKYQDTLCCVATDGGIAERKLYKNGEEVIIKDRRPMVLNGITDFVTRSDLIQRTLQIILEPITERRDEGEMLERWSEDGPRIFGALLNIFSAVLCELPNVFVPPETRLRMSDFGKLGEAVYRVLGRDASFTDDMQARINAAQNETMQNSPVCEALIELVEARKYFSFEGNFSDLRKELIASNIMRVSESNFPNYRGIANALRRNAQALRQSGIKLVIHEQRNSSGAVVEIEAAAPGYEFML